MGVYVICGFCGAKCYNRIEWLNHMNKHMEERIDVYRDKIKKLEQKIQANKDLIKELEG